MGPVTGRCRKAEHSTAGSAFLQLLAGLNRRGSHAEHCTRRPALVTDNQGVYFRRSTFAPLSPNAPLWLRASVSRPPAGLNRRRSHAEHCTRRPALVTDNQGVYFRRLLSPVYFRPTFAQRPSVAPCLREPSPSRLEPAKISRRALHSTTSIGNRQSGCLLSRLFRRSTFAPLSPNAPLWLRGSVSRPPAGLNRRRSHAEHCTRRPALVTDNQGVYFRLLSPVYFRPTFAQRLSVAPCLREPSPGRLEPAKISRRALHSTTSIWSICYLPRRLVSAVCYGSSPKLCVYASRCWSLPNSLLISFQASAAADSAS